MHSLNNSKNVDKKNKVKICKHCGEIIEEPVHGNQKYHHEAVNNNTESCAELAHKENVCNAVRNYRNKYGRKFTNDIGSRNANLGASALTDFDEEFEQVHKEKLRLIGN